jgi:hypothetical protein
LFKSHGNSRNGAHIIANVIFTIIVCLLSVFLMVAI